MERERVIDKVRNGRRNAWREEGGIVYKKRMGKKEGI